MIDALSTQTGIPQEETAEQLARWDRVAAQFDNPGRWSARGLDRLAEAVGYVPDPNATRTTAK